MKVYLTALMDEARSLKSEHGENPEYDRALVELIANVGGRTFVDVARELGISDKWNITCATCGEAISETQASLSRARADDAPPECKDCCTAKLTRARAHRGE